MFSVNDRLKIKLDVLEHEISHWKGSQPYDNLMKAAKDQRFEIVGVDNSNYVVKREDGEVFRETRAVVETSFEKVND
jgi:hypothetical protein